MAVQARGVTQESVALMHLTSEEPLLWMEPDQGHTMYSTTKRLTGDGQDSWFGYYDHYSSLENTGVIGVNSTAAKTTTDDHPAIIWQRQSGRVKFGSVVSRTVRPLSRFHIEDGALVMEALSADPADPGAGRFVLWLSDGTASGDAGDVMIKINNGVSTKTITLVDFSEADSSSSSSSSSSETSSSSSSSETSSSSSGL